VSAIPARALYQPAKAANSPKYPPALVIGTLGIPSLSKEKLAIIRRRKVMSRNKNKRKKATVDRRVQINKRVVKMNQPARKKPMAL